MTSLLDSVCSSCKHWKPPSGRTCDAFPYGVPDDIRMGKNKHDKPYPGDHGIRFEPIE